MSEYCVLLTTCATVEIAEQLATTLVTEQLVACVNIVPTVMSVYQWQGELMKEQECLLIMKTLTKIYPDIEQRLLQIHPYSVPELIQLPITQGLNNYLQWVIAQVMR